VRAMWSIGSFTCRGSSLTPARSQGEIKTREFKTKKIFE
jgi:hypothetical protein